MKDSVNTMDRNKDDKDRKNDKSKNKKGKNNKKAQLNIRLSQTEKRRVSKQAGNSGLNLAEYTRARLFGGDGKQQDPGMMGQCVVLCQDILNIVQEKYSCEENSILEEKVEKLWKILS